MNPPLVSVIIPVFNGASCLDACLAAVQASAYQPFEVILIDDGSTDATATLLGGSGYTLLRNSENLGPALSRTIAARASRGDILFFLDADILMPPDALSRMVIRFQADPGLAAQFCMYQPETLPANFFSRYKNYLHHYTHQHAEEQAVTFCAGFGAVRREVFFGLGGFSPGQRYLEDIEFGYRMHQAGHRILLNKAVQFTHMKHYSFCGLLKSDLFGRAIPWTRLMLEKRIFRSDLNTRYSNLLSVAMAFLIPTLLILRMPGWAILAAAGLLLLNRDFFAFVRAQAGLVFALKTVLMQGFAYLYSGIGLIIGIFLHIRGRR
jgi:glycosyltransferase involved in cell wall biosynthesis